MAGRCRSKWICQPVLLLGPLALGACGQGQEHSPEHSAGGSPKDEQTRHATGRVPTLSLSWGGKSRLDIDAAGKLFLGFERSFSNLTPETRAPRLSLDSFVFRFDAAPGAGAWQRGEVPTYAPPVGGACNVGAEQAALAALFDGNEGPLDWRDARAGGACQTKVFLTCFLRVWSEPSPVDGRSFSDLWLLERKRLGASVSSEGSAKSVAPEVAFALAQAAQRAAQCAGKELGVGQGVPGSNSPGGSFVVTRTSLLFTPSPLQSLSVYAGTWTSYDDALVSASPVAFVAVPDSCKVAGGACVSSPWPITKCEGCNKLVMGRTYTVFLLERAGQLGREVKRVTFVR